MVKEIRQIAGAIFIVSVIVKRDHKTDLDFDFSRRIHEFFGRAIQSLSSSDGVVKHLCRRVPPWLIRSRKADQCQSLTVCHVVATSLIGMGEHRQKLRGSPG
jgi:hypothetical protein